MYYVSVVIKDKNDSQAWRCFDTKEFPDYKSVKELVEKYRSNHRVLAAWVRKRCTENKESIL